MTVAMLRLALPVAGLALAACAAPPPAGPRYPAPTAVPTTLTYQVTFAGAASQPTAAEAVELEHFLETLPAGRALGVQIVGGGARMGDAAAAEQLAAARVRAVAKLVEGRLDTEPTLALAAGGAVAAGAVELRVDTLEVLLPPCPDWSRDPAFAYRNLPLANLGCANAVNLGLMVADPADLVRPTQLGPADGVREAEAIARYRTDKVKELEADVLTQ